MSVILALTIGLLFAVAVLQVLQRNIVRIVIGLYLLWNAANLLLVAVTRIRGDRAPFHTNAGGTMTDPLVQAFVLTAIIITFGFAAFLVTLVIWLARDEASLDLDELREARDP